METLSIVVVWSLGMVTALLAFRAVTHFREFAKEMRQEFARMESRLSEIEGMGTTLRTDAEIQLRALANIAVEARTILERARAVTQLSPSLEGEQLRRLLDTKKDENVTPKTSPESPKMDEVVNTIIEDKAPSVRSLFS